MHSGLVSSLRAGTALLATASLLAAPLSAQSSPADAYRDATARITAEAIKPETGAKAWNRIAELTDKYPARMSGSTNLEGAIRWASELMKRDGLSNVRVDKVMVPHWVRGEETAAIVGQYAQPLTIAALGGSVGTAQGGVQGEVLVVKSFDELEAHAAEARGKIIVYNVAFDETADPIRAYSQTTPYRGTGASRAAKLGAIGALIRSVGPVDHMTPHTGAMRYADDAPKIPVAGLAAEDALKLQRMQDRGDRVTVNLSLGAHQLPDAESGNVIAELTGRERPDEIVLLGCHIDSWDLAAGAMDDAGGCVAIWEAALLLKTLKLQPRRTIRVVFFTNEENGVSGGRAYAERYKDQLARHMLAIETDDGQLPIKGYGFRGTEQAGAIMKDVVPLMAGLGGTAYRTTAIGGTDIQPLVRGGNVPVIVLDVDMSRYFHIHHTNADTVDKIVPADLARLTGALASWAYVAAEMPTPLDRAPVSKAP